MTKTLPLGRGLLLALLALFGSALGACDGAMALGGPSDRFVIAPAPGDAEASPSPEDVQEAATIIRTRLEGMGLVVRKIEPGTDGRITLEVSGKDAEKSVAAAIGIKGDLAIRLVDTGALPEDTDQGIAPPGSEILPMADGSMAVAVRKVGGISGKRVEAAMVGIDQSTGQSMVMVTFDAAGASKFAQLSGANVGKPLAIVLDGKVLSAPVINEPITGGQAQISGGFTVEEANQLAVALQSGALPVVFTVAEHTGL